MLRGSSGSARSATTSSASTRRSTATSSISILRGRQILEDWEVWRRQPDVYLNPGMQRHLHASSCTGCGRWRSSSDAAVEPHAADPGQPRRRDAQPAARARAGDLPRPRREPGARRRPLRARDPARAGRRRAASGEARRGGRGRRRRLRRVRRVPRGDAPRRHRRVGPRRGALLAPCCARRSCWASTRASCATAARPRTTASPTELARCARELRGHRRLEGGPRRAQRGPSAHAGGDARSATRTGPSAPGSSSASIGLVSFPDGEACAVVPSPPFQRPVLAVAVVHAARRRSATGCTATSSCRSRPTAPRTRRSRSGSRRTRIPASRRPPSTRPTPATTGTS